MSATDQPAIVLRHPDGEFETGIRRVTEQPCGFEIGSLLSSTGLVTYDPGFGNTAGVASAITYIDGDAGILRYRGRERQDRPCGGAARDSEGLVEVGEEPAGADAGPADRFDPVRCGIPRSRGSVMAPVNADAVAVSGPRRNTLSSRVPDRPGKFLGTVRRLLRPTAGA